jgi:hypothetical protein
MDKVQKPSSPEKQVYMYMCPIPNGFRDRAISKIVDMKERLRTVSITGIFVQVTKLVQFT